MSLEASAAAQVQPSNPIVRGSHDVRMMSAMRLALAAAALLIIWFDPPKPNQFLPATYITLGFYTLYSLFIYVASIRWSRLVPTRFLHWIDLAWYVLLILLSGGTDSVFFFFFFFAILTASFARGYSWGLRVTLISTLLFSLIAYLVTPAGGHFEWNRFLLRYVNILVIGYIIAYWGGAEITLRERLGLLKEVSSLSNPRFGVDQTLQSMIERVRGFYDAESCLLIFPKDRKGDGLYRLHRVDRDSKQKSKPIEMTGAEAATLLLPSSTQAAIYRKRGGKTLLYDVQTRRLFEGTAKAPALLNAFESKSCLTVPLSDRNQSRGRLFIVGGRRRFDQAEIEFVLQLIEQVIPLLENIRLVDRLASDAAEHERRKIGQDIHDSVIQPYIGLQFGLAAVTQKLKNGNSDVRNEIQDLLEMTETEIKDLRQYVGELRRGESPQNAFMPSVRHFAAKFSDATGLQVEINSSDDLPIGDRLAAELFQMIEEGLSNIRRHSSSSVARVAITREKSDVILRLTNQRQKDLNGVSFVPRSIADRAAALGGKTVVYTDKNNDTVVSVQIPL
ncbi:MAG TPA: histidine kinase [Pyrinomonadaceae bacterium]|nr:histidine kinase [Pyrinomonadaceae bacterium]